jgi:hypothetical protein
MKRTSFYGGTLLLLLCGCATEPPPAVVEEADTMLHLGANLRPENLFFPEYLFLADFELDQHPPRAGKPLCLNPRNMPSAYWRS